MPFLTSTAIALACFLLAIRHLHQGLENYSDFVAALLVIGGTLSVSIVVLPWTHYKDVIYSLRSLILGAAVSSQEWAKDCMDFLLAVRTQKPPRINSGKFYDEILSESYEFIQIGIPIESIEQLIHERILNRSMRFHQVVQGLKSLAKYPPAFGLIGTVFGLVSLMRSISNGSPTQEIGVRMAVALIATLYGLIIANLIINPAAEQVFRYASDEKKIAETLLRCIIQEKKGASLLTIQEFLNSHFNKSNRKDYIGLRNSN